MISWKLSFKRLHEEYETAEKKKQALDNLLKTGKISQSTRDLFNAEIVEAIAEIERRQKDLLQKMNSKMMELDDQIKTLEILLANFEIQHVTGEIEEEIYQREIDVLSMGLETSKQELSAIKEAAKQIAGIDTTLDNQSSEERLQEPILQFVKTSGTETIQNPQETAENSGEQRSTETATESEERQEA